MDKWINITKLVTRMQKLGIKLEFFANYPWIYLDKVNGNRIQKQDYFNGNHGFTIAFMPMNDNELIQITNIKETFKIIRKYAKRS